MQKLQKKTTIEYTLLLTHTLIHSYTHTLIHSVTETKNILQSAEKELRTTGQFSTIFPINV